MKNKYIKLFMLIISVFVLSGCANIKRDSIEDISNYIINYKRPMVNHVNGGYKYYIPRGLSVSYKTEYNEVIKSSKYEYYLYVDLISYYNKVESTYNTTDDIYYSKLIDGNKGVVNITKKDKKYLVDINYNYAQIQIVVSEADLKMAVSNALIMISSIQYNEDVINALFDEGVLSLNDKPINVFKTNDDSSKNDLLEVDDDIIYQDDDNKDRDYIN